MKYVLILAAVALVGYGMFNLGSVTATSEFKGKLDSLTSLNDSLEVVNYKDDIKIAQLQTMDSALHYEVAHQKVKVIKIKEEVASKQNEIDSYDEHQIVSFYNQRYPKDTVTNPLPIAQPVLVTAAKDLAAFDGAKQEITIKDSIITIQDNRIALKDSTIVLFQNKEGRYKSIIGNQDLKIEQWSKQYNNLWIENKKMKVKSKFTRIGTGLILGGLIYMTISK